MSKIERDPVRASAALLLTRLVVAFIFVWHGLPKAVNPDWAMEKFVEFGLPGWLGPVTGVVEVAAAALLTLGIFHGAAAVVLAVIIVGALVTVQIPGGFTAGLERDLLILAATLTLAVLGPGRFAFARPAGPYGLTSRRSAPSGRTQAAPSETSASPV